MSEGVTINAAPRKTLLDYIPVLSFAVVVMVQAIVFVWFMAGLDSRTTRNTESINALTAEVKFMRDERGEIGERLVRMETLLTEVLKVIREP